MITNKRKQNTNKREKVVHRGEHVEVEQNEGPVKEVILLVLLTLGVGEILAGDRLGLEEDIFVDIKETCCRN